MVEASEPMLQDSLSGVSATSLPSIRERKVDGAVRGAHEIRRKTYPYSKRGGDD